MMGLWRSNDLALARDPSSRFLTGLLAVMVFLAALATIGALSARSFAGDWSAALTDRVTVQVPPLIGELSEGMVLKLAVKYQRIAETKGIPRDNH